MPSLRFRILNVFTHERDPLSGNPLCVFESGASLDTTSMQRLARQFNLSETTFLLPSERATARVRIFTPHYEMPFAGHPTLGSAHVCRALGLCADEASLEMQAGVIPVRASNQCWTLQANSATWRDCEVSSATLADMLGIAADEVAGPALWVKAGKEQLIVPLKSAAAVQRVRPSADKFAAVTSEDGHSMAYVFAPLAANRILGRFFFPADGALLEDPATGSATANLGGWMIATGRTLPCSFDISQGEYAGRPSTLLLEVDSAARIFVGGEVIELGRGTIDL